MKKFLWVFLVVLFSLVSVNSQAVLTNYPNGVASFGIPVVPDEGINPQGVRYFVDDTGSNGNSGASPDQALLTITKALSLCTSGRGDTIYVLPGSYAETVSITKDDVTIRGVTMEEVGGAVITGATDATATFTITGDNVTLSDLTINPYDAGGDMAVISASAAPNLKVIGCTVTGGQNSIKLAAACNYTTIEDNRLLNIDDNDGSATIGGSNVKVVDSNYVTIKNNQIFNDVAAGKVHGIVDNDSDYLTIEGNRAFGTSAAAVNTGAFVLITETSGPLNVANNVVFYYAAVIAEYSSAVAVHGLGTGDLEETLTVDSIEVPTSWYNGNFGIACSLYFDTTGLSE